MSITKQIEIRKRGKKPLVINEIHDVAAFDAMLEAATVPKNQKPSGPRKKPKPRKHDINPAPETCHQSELLPGAVRVGRADGEDIYMLHKPDKSGAMKPYHVRVPVPVEGRPDAAMVDTLTFTVREDIYSSKSGRRGLVTDEDFVTAIGWEMQQILGITLGPKLSKGRNNYAECWELAFWRKGGLVLGHNPGFIAIGGNADTICVHLTGEACASINATGFKALSRYLENLGAKITRVDVAHDDYDGSRSVDGAVSAYLNDEFTNGGRPPKCSQAGNWIRPDGSGRTFYIGSPKSGKLLRVYEKGREQGDMESEWVRHELQLRSTDRVIPWDVLRRPGDYLAGSYPYMAWVSRVQDRIKTMAKTAKIAYSRLVKHAKTAYGRLINVMLEVEESAEAVLAALIREDGPPKRLIDIGLAD